MRNPKVAWGLLAALLSLACFRLALMGVPTGALALGASLCFGYALYPPPCSFLRMGLVAAALVASLIVTCCWTKRWKPENAASSASDKSASVQ